MKACTYCGRENEDAAAQCVECGTVWVIPAARKFSFGVFSSIFGLLVLALMVAIILPSLPRYNIASVSEARAFAQMEDAEIVDELGDTNGPYRLKGATVGAVGKPFDFNLTFNGRTTNWSRPASNHMWFVAVRFENRSGNQFAVVMKRIE